MSVSPPPSTPRVTAARRRYAIVGLGSRGALYQDGIERTHARWAELVGVCDSNPGRIEVARRRSVLNGMPPPAGHAAADFSKMIHERRWHAQKKNSGGLFVHKSTHHFDLVNWWRGAMPESVTATGKRDFYTPEMARRLGLSGPHERCRTCPEQERCGFYFDLEANPALKAVGERVSVSRPRRKAHALRYEIRPASASPPAAS